MKLPTLADALRGARNELSREQPPADLYRRVVQAAAPAAPAPRRSAARALPWLGSGAMACTALLVGSVVLMLRAPAEHAAPELAPHMSGFVPVVAADRWPEDSAAAWLVSTELRRDRLALLGLPFDPGRAGESVRAELLVRASGEVLAVRLMP